MNIGILITFLLSLIFFILLIYPYIIYPIILRTLPKRKIFLDDDYSCSATLVFCAYNEESSIDEKLKNIQELKARYPHLEVLAFDDGSTDRTVERILAHGSLVELVQGGGRNGKAYGMKLLAKKAMGDIIIFTDANVVLREDAIGRLMAYYADAEIGGVCGSLHYLGSDASATATVGSAYWRLEEYLKDQESRTGNVMGADGSIFSIRRHLYPEFPDSVLDDLTVSMAAVFSGHRLVKANDVVAYERLITDRGDEFKRKVRIASRAFHTHLYLRPQLRKMTALDQFKYFSRKYVRWFGGLFLVLSSACIVSSALMFWPPLGFALALAIAAILAIGMRVEKGRLANLADIVIALFATLLGIYRTVRGKTTTVWQPAKSR